MSYLLSRLAEEHMFKQAKEDKQDTKQDPPTKGDKSVGAKVKGSLANAWGSIKGFSGAAWDDIKSGAKALGDHIADNKYGYTGAGIGAVAGVPVGLGIANMTGMSATEKVLTTILSSGAMAGLGGYIGHSKDAAYKQADDQAGVNAYNRMKGGFKAVGDHFGRNKGKYIGGAIGAATAVPVGAAIAETAQMSPTEKLITMIASGLVTTGTGITIGHYMDSKK